jgi:hypothetical protein
VGRLLITVGCLLVVTGLVMVGVERLVGNGGRLPGDLSFGGRGWTVSAPLGACILVSVVLTLLLNIVLWWGNRR